MKPNLETLEKEVIEKQLDIASRDLRNPEVLYQIHSVELERLRQLNKRYYELTGSWYCFDTSLR